MRLVLIATIFIASCIAGPLAQIEEVEQEWPTYTVGPVDIAPEEFEPLNANLTTLVSRDTLPNTSCPPGQTYDRSVCIRASRIRSFCVANPRSNREQITDRDCASDEICVQRNLRSGKPYAKCLPVRQLVEWKTSPDGNKEGCSNINAHPDGVHHMGTIIYDANKNPIQVDKIRYFGEPGNKDEGIGGAISSFSSDLFTFNAAHYLKGKCTR
jgi:hypothetical protein